MLRFGAVLVASGSSPGALQLDARDTAVVTRVVDGDTIDVAIGGRDERVRLLGIDTPEVHVAEGAAPECFGPEASAFTGDLLPDGHRVRLERDVVGRDDYGRLLAYVYLVDDGALRQRGDRPAGLRTPAAHRAERSVRGALRGRGSTPPRPRGSACGRRAADSVAPWPDQPLAHASLAERLGHAADARLVIISCDDLGLCHAANVGVYRAMRDGAATCASLMVPAPWARHAAATYEAGDDIGVHLTLNAEHRNYRWGPITHAPSLLAGDGGFPRSIDDLWEHADPEEVRRECRAQIERALAWGIDVTHLAPHLTAITLRPEFFDVYLDWPSSSRCRSACRRRSPPSRPGSRSAGWPPRRASSSPTTSTTTGGPAAATVSTRRIRDLEPGVTEIHVQPAIDTPEVRALSAAGGGVDRRPRARRRRPEAADAAGRGRRGADRLRRAQGRDASRAERLAASPDAQQPEQRARSDPVDFSLPCM